MDYLLRIKYDEALSLYSIPVTFKCGNGEMVTLNSVYQDVSPSSAPICTVIAIHGAPGTHRDFKYMIPHLKQLNIRFIGVNFPGHGFSQNDFRLMWTNEERNEYIKALINTLNISPNSLLFIGHSRGAENALQLGEFYKDFCLGVILVNSPGLRRNRGTEPWWLFQYFFRIAFLKSPHTYPLIEKYFKTFLPFRVPSGEVGASALMSMSTFQLDEKRGSMQKLMESSKPRFMFCYSGSDPAIETEISEEFVNAFGIKKLNSDSDNVHDPLISKQMREAFDGNERFLAVCFSKGDHYLQKHQAQFIADVAQTFAQKSKL